MVCERTVCRPIVQTRRSQLEDVSELARKVRVLSQRLARLSCHLALHISLTHNPSERDVDCAREDARSECASLQFTARTQGFTNELLHGLWTVIKETLVRTHSGATHKHHLADQATLSQDPPCLEIGFSIILHIT